MTYLFALCSIGLHLLGRGLGQVEGGTHRFGVSAVDRTTLVLAINSLRGRVEPTAANMAFLVWSSTLEESAQAWVDACDYDLGQPSMTTSRRRPKEHVLTAVHAMEASYSVDAALKAWYGQERLFDHEAGACTETGMCDHYVALVSATARYVGCGVARWGQVTIQHPHCLVHLLE